MSEASGGPPPGWPTSPTAGAFGPGQTELGDPGALEAPYFPAPSGADHGGGGVPVYAHQAGESFGSAPSPGSAGAPVAPTIVDPEVPQAGMNMPPPFAPPFAPPPVGVAPIATTGAPSKGPSILVIGALSAVVLGGGTTAFFLLQDGAADESEIEAVELPPAKNLKSGDGEDSKKRKKARAGADPEPVAEDPPPESEEEAPPEPGAAQDPSPPVKPAADPPPNAPPATPPPATPPPATPPPAAPPKSPPPPATPPPKAPPSGPKKRPKIPLPK